MISNEFWLQIQQTKQSFPFGSAISYNYIAGEDEVSRKYQEYFYGLFNWAVMTNAMKWRFTEAVEVSASRMLQSAHAFYNSGCKFVIIQGQPYFGTIDKVMAALHANKWVTFWLSIPESLCDSLIYALHLFQHD